MKKLASLLLLISLGVLNTHAQGTIAFQNSSSFPILVNNGVSPNFVIGTSNAAYFCGAGPGQVNVQMYVALASAPSTFYLAGTTTNSGSTSSLFLGTFHGGSPYSIPSTLDGGAFTQGTMIDYYFIGYAEGGAWGESAVGTGYTLGGGSSSPTATFGTGAGEIQGFIMGVPEPSTLAIGGLGALAAVLYRRRK